MALVGLAGLDLRGATAHTKVVNFTSNLVALAVFLSAGAVIAPLGMAMGAAEVAGAWAGSRMVLERGTGFVRARDDPGGDRRHGRLRRPPLLGGELATASSRSY